MVLFFGMFRWKIYRFSLTTLAFLFGASHGLGITPVSAQGLTGQYYTFVGVAGDFIPIDGETLLEAGQKPYGPDSSFTVVASSTNVSVDLATGTLNGTVSLTVSGDFTSTQSTKVTCTETITETTTLSGKFDPAVHAEQNGTNYEFASGASQYSRTVNVTSLNVPSDYDTFFGTPDLTWCGQSWTSEGKWYALRNDSYDLANTTAYAGNTNEHVTLYTEVPYHVLGRAWLDVPVPDLSIQRVQPIQVIQDASDSIPLVAGKSTAVRVYPLIGVKPLEPITGVSATLRAYRNNVELPNSPLYPWNGSIVAQNLAQESNLDTTLNFLLPKDWTEPGDTQLVIELSPPAGLVENPANNTITKTLAFTRRGPLIISYLPICWQAPGQSLVCPSNAITTGAEMIKKLFPVADEGVVYTKLPVQNWIYQSPRLGGDDFDTLISQLRKRYDLIDSVDGIISDQLAGWLPDVPAAYLGLSDPLWAEKGGQGRVTLQIDSSTARLKSCEPAGQSFTDPQDPHMTLAHEIGHNLGLRHTNTPDGCGAEDSGTPWPYANGTIQNYGIDLSTKTLVPPNKFDVITYNSPPASNIWISPFSYLQLYNGKLDPQKTVSGMSGTSGTVARYLVISGTIQADGSSGTLDPGYVVTSSIPTVTPSAEGNYCIRLGSSGAILSDYCFLLEFTNHKTETPLTQQTFSVKIPFSEGANEAHLLVAGTATYLDSVSASAHAPEVLVSGVTAGQTLSGSQPITWTGSDPDGESLSYVVTYSPDQGQHWYPLAVDVTESEFVLDTAALTPGTEEYLRVIASDGFQTSLSEVGPFTIEDQSGRIIEYEDVDSDQVTQQAVIRRLGWWIVGILGVGVGLGLLVGAFFILRRRKKK